MLKIAKYRQDPESGQVIVLAAMAMLFFVALIVVVGDNALVRMQKRNLQNSADAAVLAGVQELPGNPTEAVAKAQEYADKNLPDLDGFEYELLDNNHTIRVIVRKHSGALFGGALTLGNPEVSAVAAASVQYDPLPYSLMAMNSSACSAMDIHGGATVQVSGGGGTYTHSSCNTGLTVRGTARLNSSLNHVVGGKVAQGMAQLNPPAQKIDPPELDPFASLSQPDPTGMECRPQQSIYSSGHHTLQQGRYCQKLNIQGAHITLESGIYIFERGVSVTSFASLTSNGGVLLFSTCPTYPCNGSVPDEIYVAAQASVSVSGYPPRENIVLWVDRTAGSGVGIRLEGQAAQGFDGMVYAVGSTFRIAGGNNANMTLNMAVVADKIDISGQGTITIPYNVEIAPSTHSMRLIE